MLRKILLIITFFYFFGCKSQEYSENYNKDIELSNIYKKFDDNKFDYGDLNNEGRDTILNRFKSTLVETLKDKNYVNISFDSLSLDVKIIKSLDKKLRLYSWDEFNNGTWHIYNTAYQYIDGEKIYAGILPIDKNRYLEAIHYDIVDKIDNSYLVKAYGTHGSGKEFYVFRLLSFKNGKVKDCTGCFNGKDKFVYEISRGKDELIPKYNDSTREIQFYELTESYIDGDENSPSGFMVSTGNILTLKYKDGLFIATD